MDANRTALLRREYQVNVDTNVIFGIAFEVPYLGYDNSTKYRNSQIANVAKSLNQGITITSNVQRQRGFASNDRFQLHCFGLVGLWHVG